ncbi:hypothetical protein [Persephonella sp.]
MDIGKFRHDINSFIFKMEASADLLKDVDSLSPKEIKLISRIIMDNTRFLKMFFEAYFLLDKLLSGIYKPQKTPVDIDGLKLEGDHEILKITFDIIKKLNKKEKLEIKKDDNKLIFHGKFLAENQMEQFFLDFLEKALLFIKIKPEIKEDEIVLKW